MYLVRDAAGSSGLGGPSSSLKGLGTLSSGPSGLGNAVPYLNASTNSILTNNNNLPQIPNLTIPPQIPKSNNNNNNKNKNVKWELLVKPRQNVQHILQSCY